uniref:Taxilin beta n=1 Tax=Salarias fasciatus TaxID=181472 RepID=A0A672GKU3_SALFA
MEKMKEEPKADVKVSAGKGEKHTFLLNISVIMQSLNKLSSPEEKLEGLVKKYTELVRKCLFPKMSVLQQRMAVLLEERQQLHAERRSSIAARCKLETLCKELQSHYSMLREETLQRCKEEEEKRSEITSHFQSMLKEIQAQIEQHSARNDKLCRENANLTDKLESLMSQCESREESLEKINKHRDLQHKLTEAKLQQANALLAEAEEKHKREKEYLLVQAAEWKLQAQTLREQGTVMQAQLTLYAQKFDEFQDTLAKSNEIYIRFKKDMDNVGEKMKKVEKESNVWKTRFENCNKALTDMIEEVR